MKRLRLPKRTEYAFVPPDGGWGWVVVLACFYCNFVIDGVIFTSGIYLKDMEKDFNISAAMAATVPSIMFGVHFLAGPICGGLLQTIGIRHSAIIATVTLTLVLASPMLSALPFWALVLVMSIIGGVAMCIIFMATITITLLYFTTYRVHALGITSCGTGFGTIAFAFLGTYLRENLTWRLSYLVMAGFSVATIIASTTFRPLRPARIEVSDKIEPGSLFQSRQTVVDIEEDDMEVDTYRLNLTKHGSMESIVSAMTLTQKAFDQILTEVHQHAPKRFYEDCPKCCHFQKSAPVIRLHPDTKKTLVEAGTTLHNVSLYGSLEIIPRSSEGHCKKFKKFIKQVFDFRILKEPAFVAYCISGALISSAIMIVFTYEKERNLSLGYTDSHSTWFIALLGASNMFWRLILGFLSNSAWMSYKKLYMAGLTASGLMVVLSAYVTSVYFHVLYCIAFGLGHALFAVYRPAMLVEFVGLENVANATGVSLLFMGIFTIPGPPFCGWLLELRGGHFDIVFGVAGGLFLLAALLIIPLAFMRSNRNEAE